MKVAGNPAVIVQRGVLEEFEHSFHIAFKRPNDFTNLRFVLFEVKHETIRQVLPESLYCRPDAGALPLDRIRAGVLVYVTQLEQSDIAGPAIQVVSEHIEHARNRRG